MIIALSTLFWILTRLPLRVLYFLSDFLYLLAFHLVRYRRKVVRRNLERSFPEKSLFERRRLAKKAYRRFADVLVETFYGSRMSDEELKQRLVYDNVELLDQVSAKKGNCVVMASHYGNFEWLSGAGLWLESSFCTVYRRQSSPASDELLQGIRSRRGNDNVEMKQLLRVVERNYREGRRCVYGLIADQKPSPTGRHRWYWTEFLNQDTPFLTGAEYLARKYDMGVVYAHMSRVSRGHYRCWLEVICEDAAQLPEGEITERYARLLEQDIRRDPAPWLWTHNRWKYSR